MDVFESVELSNQGKISFGNKNYTQYSLELIGEQISRVRLYIGDYRLIEGNKYFYDKNILISEEEEKIYLELDDNIVKYN